MAATLIHPRIEGEELQFVAGTEVRWALGATRLAVCGEYTTEDGPYGDDHFLAFVAAGR